MIIKIKSTNKNLLTILSKNPNTFGGVQLRQIKRGVGVGRCYSDNEYHLVFQDTKYSFSEDATNQIDFQSYCNPRVALNLFSVFARHIFVDPKSWDATYINWLEKTLEDIDTAEHNHSIIIENIYSNRVKPSGDFVLTKYFPEISIEHKLGNLFRLKIETDKSVYHLINLAAFVCMYLASTNGQPWFLTEDLAKKYIRILNNVGPIPYFVAYLFARACLPSKEIFDKLKDDLAACCGLENIDMCFGGTQMQRLDAIGDRLIDGDGNIPYNIIEVGCGEMDYANRYLGKLTDDCQWQANDIEDMTSNLHRIKRKHNSDKLYFTQDIKQIPALEDSALLLVEVIEHMPIEEAISLVANSINRLSPELVLITTPNLDFNEYYKFSSDDTVFRHDDHHFELRREQLHSFINFITNRIHQEYTVEYFDIGDVINDTPMSFGVQFKKIEAHNG